MLGPAAPLLLTFCKSTSLSGRVAKWRDEVVRNLGPDQDRMLLTGQTACYGPGGGVRVRVCFYMYNDLLD